MCVGVVMLWCCGKIYARIRSPRDRTSAEGGDGGRTQTTMSVSVVAVIDRRPAARAKNWLLGENRSARFTDASAGSRARGKRGFSVV